MLSSSKVYYFIFAAFSMSVAALYLSSGTMEVRGVVFSAEISFLALICFTLIAVLMVQISRVTRIRHNKRKIDALGVENELVYKALNTHAIVSVTDSEANILQVNDKFLEVFGYTREELIGKNVSFLHAAVAGETDFSDIRDCTTKGNTWKGEHSATSKTGETRLFQATIVPYLDKDGNCLRNVCVRTDVTEMRKAEELRQNETILDKLQDEIYIFRTSDLKIIYVNDRAMQRCEWTKEEALQKSIIDTDENFQETMFRAHVSPLLSGKKDAVVISVKQKKGFVEINTSRSVQPDGTEVFVSVLRDINDRVKLNKAKMESVSVVSHELRTPITSIKGSIQLLQAKLAKEDSTSASLFDIALRNCDRLIFIVNDILDLEKIEAGKMKLNKKPLNVCKLLLESIAVNEGYAKITNVNLRFTSEITGAVVNGDKDRLIQVMSNLMSNAVKFSNANDFVDIGLVDNGTTWRITVADSGPGISIKDRAKLFESFVQVASNDHKKRAGTGLGLAITKKIIQLHGGKIGLDSNIDKGTIFYFDLKKYDTGTSKRDETILIAAE